MERLIISIVITTLILSLGGCYYDNEEELYGPLYAKQQCDTSSVSYSQHIAPLIQSKCLMCHGKNVYMTSGGGINLDGYNAISSYLNTNKTRFIGAIKWQAGYSPMPKGGTKLDNCSILKIEQWINNGYPNN